MFVCCECCVLSGRGLCDELIIRPEESYRLWCVVVCDLETSRMRRPWPALGRSATEKKIKLYFYDIFIRDLRLCVLWDVTPCSLVEICHEFWGSLFCLQRFLSWTQREHIFRNMYTFLPGYTVLRPRSKYFFSLQSVYLWTLLYILAASYSASCCIRVTG